MLIDLDIGIQKCILYFQATVRVLDENDTPPRFSQNFYREIVREDVKLASTVAKVTVTDDDTIGGLQLTISDGNDGILRIYPDGEFKGFLVGTNLTGLCPQNIVGPYCHSKQGTSYETGTISVSFGITWFA